jgi:glycosyltransferase involved in cell wall biosynthesis
MRRQRVLVVSEPMEYGVLSYLERLFAGLDRGRWEPALAYSPNRLAPQGRRAVAFLAARGVRVSRLPFQRGLGMGDGAAALGLVAEIRQFRPDVIHLHSTKAGLIGRPIARLLGIPVIYTPHGTSWHYTGRLVGRVQRALERTCRRSTDLLLAVCPEEARAFVEEIGISPTRVRVVPNGVPVPDRSELAAARARRRALLRIGESELWLLFAGRLTREKGLDVLLRALRTGVAADGLLVVGDGAERARLEAEAASIPIPVRFCGYQEDVSPFLAAADVFVQPSRSEGLPFALLEAMAHGLPVVAAAVGGMADALGGCGVVVPPERPDELGRRLREIVGDAEVRASLGEAGRARVARAFGVPTMLAGIDAAYAELTARHPAPMAGRPVRAA